MAWPARPAAALADTALKRFYTRASARPHADSWTVTLDDRPVRTPARAPLLLPTATLAIAIAAEWAEQTVTIRPGAMRLTGLANAAIDRVAPACAVFAAALAAYADTDTLLYRADEPADLASLQAETWDPLLAWAAARYDCVFQSVTGIGHRAQPPATIARVDAALAALDPFRLAALHPVVSVTGSPVVALALVAGQIDAEQAYAIGQLDELWQARRYGADPLAQAAAEERRAAIDAGARLLALL